MSLSHTLTLNVPFENSNQANIAMKVLQPDPILKPQDFEVTYTTEGNDLVASFASIDDRVLRVGVSNVIDSIKTIIETMDEL
ncbi:similar to Saccharomyces cerevisiae YKR095W-A PCC1 Component of the EKC/KEOPS protein complex with Kae1p, Gon7p, Bud32p, and Cgi121p [Maudiozyma saulgeensis]|uniref:Similar to Saccharomyces cerevisiae YKR095W-A PCC1 Component of the EKC/KEOPS protein complex with Kae1p, Gon7p, Bud32p, and Cgi121p n=1 Tax=Maudiozyma saulgeensis TaxID=1789683 RepID=A0A1X7R9H5_9SACH|nr:similar to Saccharomyces cerevisiae YKR095W-A PCC1 Component of the EKC/KEOPS protein complex with Kae1p, Gon7p, Bud32p, and Cgi121p [Kazachstania saulgeensis]SMN22307.1 similar to Saccharomyces cerevisiae YKR095W-A PCC1 Component of the EKC/KEOPS protein complex with Kae1p, Gon7p, Bud32p, and Cgi121p [Kazachstania saulgeensis]